MSTLTFAALRAANIKRLPQFKNRWGEAAHSQEDSKRTQYIREFGDPRDEFGRTPDQEG